MPDKHDDVDAWLSQRIEPLPPPPGTFDLIKRRARRRKYRKLAITAGSAAVIVAAAVTVPQVVNLPVLNQNPTAAPVAPSAAPVSGAGTPVQVRPASLVRATEVQNWVAQWPGERAWPITQPV